MIEASSRRRSLSAPRYQKTVLAARAEKEGGSASSSASSPPPGSSTDLVPALVDDVVNDEDDDDDDAAAPPVEAEDLRPDGGGGESAPLPYSSESRNERNLADNADPSADPRYISASRGMRHTSPPTSGTAVACAHAPPSRMYSSARSAFCATRSSSFLFDTDFGRGGSGDDDDTISAGDVAIVDADDDAAATVDDDDDDASSRSMPSIEDADGGVGDDDIAPAALLLARFIRNFRQSPSEFGSMDPSSSSSSSSDMNRRVPRGGSAIVVVVIVVATGAARGTARGTPLTVRVRGSENASAANGSSNATRMASEEKRDDGMFNTHGLFSLSGDA
jgi:hypothetical protein